MDKKFFAIVIVILLFLLMVSRQGPTARGKAEEYTNRTLATAGIKNPDVEKAVVEAPAKGLTLGFKFFKFLGDSVGDLLDIPIQTATARAQDRDNGGGQNTPAPPGSKVLVASISAQKPGDEVYQLNVRRFFAGVSPGGRTIEGLNEVNLLDFEGEWTFPSGESSMNKTFGWGNYEEPQEMQIPSTGGIGDGTCNAGALMAAALKKGGIRVIPDCPGHKAPIPGAEGSELTLCVPTANAASCKSKCDAIVNPSDPVTVKWTVKGDELKIWVESEGGGSGGGQMTPTPGPSQSATPILTLTPTPTPTPTDTPILLSWPAPNLKIEEHSPEETVFSGEGDIIVGPICEGVIEDVIEYFSPARGGRILQKCPFGPNLVTTIYYVDVVIVPRGALAKPGITVLGGIEKGYLLRVEFFINDTAVDLFYLLR